MKENIKINSGVRMWSGVKWLTAGYSDVSGGHSYLNRRVA
jgi:hypothetical protein